MHSYRHDDWILTAHRLAIHVPTATAVVADVHLGYREARQDSGEAIPLLDVATQLAPIRRALRQFTFDKLLIAGDLFERHVRLDLLERFLHELTTIRVAFAGLVVGNHDRGWSDFRDRMPIFPTGFELGRWRVVHGNAIESEERLVLGHWHPVVRHRGQRVPCYLIGPHRLVLPAFSVDAAGQSIARLAAWRDLQPIRILGSNLVTNIASGRMR